MPDGHKEVIVNTPNQSSCQRQTLALAKRLGFLVVNVKSESSTTTESVVALY
jgi:hypothetical protein